jgi:hypothetical protein
VNLSINPFATGTGSAASDPSPPPIVGLESVPCPSCAAEIPAATEWQTCPYCQKPLQMRVWPLVQRNNNAVTALSDQATCFFHPDKAFQACCQRCGRFVCALCDLQLGAEHVCPACFESGRVNSGATASKAEWRSRDVLYDSIALTVGWIWIFFWPVFVVALPAVIFLHVKYRKAPRAYLIPRSGWRFWAAYVGLIWVPVLVAAALSAQRMARRH